MVAIQLGNNCSVKYSDNVKNKSYQKIDLGSISTVVNLKSGIIGHRMLSTKELWILKSVPTEDVSRMRDNSHSNFSNLGLVLENSFCKLLNLFECDYIEIMQDSNLDRLGIDVLIKMQKGWIPIQIKRSEIGAKNHFCHVQKYKSICFFWKRKEEMNSPISQLDQRLMLNDLKRFLSLFGIGLKSDVEKDLKTLDVFRKWGKIPSKKGRIDPKLQHLADLGLLIGVLIRQNGEYKFC